MNKRAVFKSATVVIFVFSQIIQASSQSILTVDLKKYHEQSFDHDLGEKGALFALSKYDVNSILSVSPEGKVNWNVSVKPNYRFEYFTDIISSPDNKYVYAIYSTTHMSRHYTEFMQINDLGNTKIYEYEQLHEEKEKLRSGIAGSVKPKAGTFQFDAYYCDNKYFYRIETDGKEAKINEDLEFEISRLQHENLEFERKHFTIPGITPQSTTGNLNCDDFYIIGHDQANVYLARKTSINENGKMLFQVVGISQNLEVTSSKLIEAKLSSGNEIVKLNNTDSWPHHNNATPGTAGTIKYDPEHQLFSVYGATAQNTMFLIKLDATGKQLQETEFKFSEKEKAIYDLSSSSIINLSRNNRSLSIWTPSKFGTLDNIVVDDAGKVVKSATLESRAIAAFPRGDNPLVPVQEMKPAAIKYYSELKPYFQFSMFFKYAVFSGVHYVASIASKKELNLMVFNK